MDNKAKILDIAMNLTRIGNWAADGYEVKKKRIIIFLKNTDNNLKNVKISSLDQPFKKTFEKFLRDYPKLEQEGYNGPKNQMVFAEKMLTWGNILTHRSRLIQ